MPAKKIEWDDTLTDRPLPTVLRRRVPGESILISKLELKQGFTMEPHQHEAEQFVYLVSGSLILRTREPDSAEECEHHLVAGSLLHLPPWTWHGATALADSVSMDIFSPSTLQTGFDQKK